MPDADYYDILGLDPSADMSHIRSAYRQVAARVHPDVGGTGALFRQVHQAYETLSDPQRRASYDAARRFSSGEPFSGYHYPDPDPAPDPAPAPAQGWSSADDPMAATWPPPTDGPVVVASPRPSWAATHPSVVVTTAGALAGWLGLLAMADLAAIGMLAVVLGTLGLIGSGRARAAERSQEPIIEATAGRRFALDLRFGIPMACRFVLFALAFLVFRSELRRLVSGPRR